MLTATIKIEFSTNDQERAQEVLDRIVQNIGLSSEIVEDIYVEEPPTPEGD